MTLALHSIQEAASLQRFDRTTDAFASRTASECLVTADAIQVSYEEHRLANPVAQEHENDSTMSSLRPHCSFR